MNPIIIVLIVVVALIAIVTLPDIIKKVLQWHKDRKDIVAAQSGQVRLVHNGQPRNAAPTYELTPNEHALAYAVLEAKRYDRPRLEREALASGKTLAEIEPFFRDVEELTKRVDHERFIRHQIIQKMRARGVHDFMPTADTIMAETDAGEKVLRIGRIVNDLARGDRRAFEGWIALALTGDAAALRDGADFFMIDEFLARKNQRNTVIAGNDRQVVCDLTRGGRWADPVNGQAFHQRAGYAANSLPWRVVATAEDEALPAVAASAEAPRTASAVRHAPVVEQPDQERDPHALSAEELMRLVRWDGPSAPSETGNPPGT
jgi:hypothetical protein